MATADENLEVVASPTSLVTSFPSPVTIGKWQIAFILFSILGIAVSEYFYAYQNVGYGIGMSIALVVIMYILLSITHLDSRIIQSIESIALIPLYIIFTSCLPWFFINQQFLLPAVYSCILALCFWHIYRSNTSFKQMFAFDKSKLLKYLLIGIAIGIPTGTIEYLILRPAPATPTFEVQYLLRDTIYMLFFVGLGEELLFRGLIQKDLTAAFGWKWALLVTSLLFSIMHMTWRSVPELFFVFGAALILGGLYIKTRSLVAPILFHAVNNIMLVSIVPYFFIK